MRQLLPRMQVWQAASAAQDELRDEQQNGKHSSIKKSLVRITDIVSAREFYIQARSYPTRPFEDGP